MVKIWGTTAIVDEDVVHDPNLSYGNHIVIGYKDVVPIVVNKDIGASHIGVYGGFFPHPISITMEYEKKVVT